MPTDSITVMLKLKKSETNALRHFETSLNNYQMTDLLTYLFHGAESFLRS